MIGKALQQVLLRPQVMRWPARSGACDDHWQARAFKAGTKFRRRQLLQGSVVSLLPVQA